MPRRKRDADDGEAPVRRRGRRTRALKLADPDVYDGREMHFLDHLEELRTRILRAMIYVVVAVMLSIGWCFHDAQDGKGLTVVNFVMRPANEALRANAETTGVESSPAEVDTAAKPAEDGAGHKGKLIFTSPLEPMMTLLKIGLLVGLAASMPFIGLEIWGFVGPALTRREKSVGYIVVLVCPALFVTGASFIYLILPTALKFLLMFTRFFEDAEFLLNPNQYLNMMLTLMAGMGCVFQMPVVIGVLVRIGLVSSAALLRFWRHATVIMIVLAAVITPTWDPLNLSIVVAPMMALYFGSIVLAKFIERGNRRREAAERERYEVFEPSLPPPYPEPRLDESEPPPGDPEEDAGAEADGEDGETSVEPTEETPEPELADEPPLPGDPED